MSNSLRHAGLAALLLLASLVLWWAPLRATFDLAFSSPEHTHLLLILPLSVALAYMGRGTVRGVEQPEAVVGSFVLILALALAGIGKWIVHGDWSLSVSILALVVWWIGSVVLLAGRRMFSAFLFPLCFLLWLVPIPESALEEVTGFMQLASAFAAKLLFHVVAVPVTQDGIMLSIPGLDLAVARECSSLRSSLMLMLATMVLAHLFLRATWRKVLLVMVALPLAIAKNGLRIFTIAELATRVDPDYLDGRLHHHGGPIFLAISLAAMIALLWGLHRGEMHINQDGFPATGTID